MLTIIQEREVNIKVTSLILEPDVEHPNMFKAFHCSDCGKVAFQYSGHIIMSVPGGVKTLIPLIKMCATCKKRYLIASSM